MCILLTVFLTILTTEMPDPPGVFKKGDYVIVVNSGSPYYGHRGIIRQIALNQDPAQTLYNTEMLQPVNRVRAGITNFHYYDLSLVSNDEPDPTNAFGVGDSIIVVDKKSPFYDKTGYIVSVAPKSGPGQLWTWYNVRGFPGDNDTIIHGFRYFQLDKLRK